MLEANENSKTRPTVGTANQSIVKRSIVINGHKTSVSLEDAFWWALREIATAKQTILSQLVASIDSGRQNGNLSSAIRLFVLDYYRAQSNVPVPNSESQRDAPSY